MNRHHSVLINLFGNALKFTSTGSITLIVAPDGLPCTDGSRRIRFEVEDTGKGMSQEFLRDHLCVRAVLSLSGTG